VQPGRVNLANTCQRLPLCVAFGATCGLAPIHDEEAVRLMQNLSFRPLTKVVQP